ncbi:MULTISPECIES: hypothetical protein [unclassified Rhizobium]|uniref:hypothetical protein n=1 Tax=unclassified Rhizobium TaxID=2613769 RepID=UPI001A99FB7F|nr:MULTISPECIES: hypothetical protein [unclassified Rhizobium]MBX5159344.1 hypothetical protein [Rhizobium sp. NZLR8]MBX5167741.1 hypothetical protein [Rhizobium sp. NZLR4b]MBX5170900.1 hypothetical protein [Rhizobium sp. NZLR1b]MBX5181709.1 hypothetical protein [Rhizobium sp. NZLR5]MBX5199710.1 hypothetical protein [Rhizobium sp. NZLR10]
MLCVPIFAYIWANVFSILVDQTAVSMLSASLATALPCACLAIYFIYSRQIKRKPDPQISTAKALGIALSGLALVALAAYGMGQITTCTNAKCRGGTELFGHFRFGAFYLICLWGGWISMCSFLILHDVLRRFFKWAIK